MNVAGTFTFDKGEKKMVRLVAKKIVIEDWRK